MERNGHVDGDGAMGGISGCNSPSVVQDWLTSVLVALE